MLPVLLKKIKGFMKILIVCATEKEVSPLLEKLSLLSNKGGALRTGRYKNHFIDVLITGVGMVPTAYYCAKTISDTYDLALNAGLAGSFREDVPVGAVVNVVNDRFSELGAQDGEKLLTLKEIPLEGTDEISNAFLPESAAISRLLKVKGITVNTVHGNDRSIREVVEKFNPDIETMEGAAFLFVCKSEGIPCVQVRAISNFVERRNKEKWNIPLAVKKLHETLVQILEGF